MTDFEQLNQHQLEAVTSTEGYVRVIAGAGSGKTRALSHRFAYLVNDLGILPKHILCVTFTNKSANEMRHRIQKLTGDNDTGYINTFHGFCVSVLQEDSHAVSYPKSFLVLDNSDINEMLKIIYEERGLSLRDMTFAQARDMIEIEKLVNRPEYYHEMIRMSVEELKANYDEAITTKDIIFYGYLYQEKKNFGLDYNDLIKYTLYIFEENEEIRLKWQKRLEYIMIDEFQDIDELQYELMDVLQDYHHNLFVVGDPDQTIYTWRGAKVEYILNFGKHYPGTKTILMNENYRSTPKIIAVSNDLIAKNKNRIPKDLLPMRENVKHTIAGPTVVDAGGQTESTEVVQVLCHHADTTELEAKWIADEVKRLNEKEGVALRDMSILYRAHYVTRSVEEAFLEAKIPYTIYSGTQFFDRAEIKDAVSYLRMVAYQDDLSLRRVINQPKRNIGKRRMEFLEEEADKRGCSLYEALLATRDHEIFRGTDAEGFIELIEKYRDAYEGMRISDLFTELLDQSGLEAALRTEGSQERLDNLAELKQSIFEYEVTCGEEGTLPDYLHHIALFTNTDVEEVGDKVKLMTVHTAKGLEFPVVFLCGMNEGIFPSRKVKSEEGMEEERRLAFVAVTRAKDRLYLSEATGRNHDGSPRYPSRFILHLSEDVLVHEPPMDSNLMADAERYIKTQIASGNQTSAFSVGDRIKHMVFGEGIITAVDEDEKFYTVKFDQFETERNLSFKVKLEKV